MREQVAINKSFIILFFLSDTLGTHVPFGELPVSENNWQGCSRLRSFIHEAQFRGAGIYSLKTLFVMVMKSNAFNAQVATRVLHAKVCTTEPRSWNITKPPHGGHQGFLCLLPFPVGRQGLKQGRVLHMLSNEREN